MEINRAYLVLLGGFCLHLYLGCFYLWGNISVYFTSYFHQFDPSLTVETTYCFIPIEQVAHMSFNPVSAYLYKKIGPTACIILGASVGLIGQFASSFVTNFWAFVILYAVVYGVGIGLCYMSPLMAGWEHLSN